MEYKYFKQTPEGYEPKKTSGAMYFAVALCTAFGILFIWYAVKTGHPDGYTFSLVFFGLTALMILLQYAVRVTISPATRTVTYKTLRGKKSYPLSEFLNFQITNVRVNGFVTRRRISMFFNDNGKNKNILLGAVMGRKSADAFVAEAQSLLS